MKTIYNVTMLFWIFLAMPAMLYVGKFVLNIGFDRLILVALGGAAVIAFLSLLNGNKE